MPALAVRHQCLSVSKEALPVILRSLRFSRNLLIGRLLLQLNCEIHHGNIDRWHTEGHAMPVSFPFTSGITFAAALPGGGQDDVARACPSWRCHLRRRLRCVCVGIMAWQVVIKPRLMPHFSCITHTAGARPLVVQGGQHKHSMDRRCPRSRP